MLASLLLGSPAHSDLGSDLAFRWSKAVLHSLRLSCGDPQASFCFQPTGFPTCCCSSWELTKITGRGSSPFNLKYHSLALRSTSAWLLFSGASMFTQSFFLLASFLPFFPSSLPPSSLPLSLPLLALFHFLILTTDQGKGSFTTWCFFIFNDQSASATSQRKPSSQKAFKTLSFGGYFICKDHQPFLKQILSFFWGLMWKSHPRIH